MQGNLYYKKYIEKLINSNPTTIDITRVTKVPDGYGGRTETKTTKSVIVTIYQKKSFRQIVDDSGITVTNTIDKLLAKGDADIIKGDVFSVNGQQYKVLLVNDYFDICKQIELDVIA